MSLVFKLGSFTPPQLPPGPLVRFTQNLRNFWVLLQIYSVIS